MCPPKTLKARNNSLHGRPLLFRQPHHRSLSLTLSNRSLILSWTDFVKNQENENELENENEIYCPKIHANISGTTIVASLSTMNLGVFAPSLPQVIFSFGTAPE
jgi:hypothetical protein